MQALKILMSAYACEPNKGSEPGIGWRWALETARLGHEVWVITRINNREGIARGLSQHGKPKNLHFIYYDLPGWARWWKRGSFGVHLYYTLWQWGAFKRARQLHAEQHFDAVHHITFGVTRHPSLMGRLGIPLILGPMGGGERAPVAIRKYCSLSGKIRDVLRDAINTLARLDPWLHQMYDQATLIMLKTPESRDWLPKRYHAKAICMLEIGVDERINKPALEKSTSPATHTLNVLYVGRFAYFKGMDLGLRAVANLRARQIPVRLTMIGQGPARLRWQLLAAKLRLASCATWVPWMQQQDLLNAYQTYDVLLFPSLHDSSGNVLLEAMASGLPVVCLDLGGPSQIVTPNCGRAVPVKNQNADQVVEALADALTELATDAKVIAGLRQGALIRAKEFSWQRVVAQVWGSNGVAYQAVVHPATGSQYVAA